MIQLESAKESGSKPARISYWVMLGTFVAVGWLHLAMPMLVVFFAFLALTKLQFGGRCGKWLAAGLFLVLLSGIAYGLGFFINQTVRALPEIANEAIPSIIQWAKQHQIELPFTDYDGLKDLAFDTVKSQVVYLGSAAKLARGAGTQFVLVVVGCVVALGLFAHPSFELDRNPRQNNLYSMCCDQLAERFRTFYRSFETVMGAQILISAINTVLTAIFVLVLRLPHPIVIVGMTFLCGLLPVVGNLISNTIIVGIAFTLSPQMALAALIFLVVIHKLEYFLNSKIIGHRIRNPLWLTLLGLVVGEKLMGIPGMILAPVVLNYLKLEMSKVEVKSDEDEPVSPASPPYRPRVETPEG